MRRRRRQKMLDHASRLDVVSRNAGLAEPFLGRRISCERISEVDEEETSKTVSDPITSSRSSSVARSASGAFSETSPSETLSAPLDDDDLDSRDDATLADLSTVSNLSSQSEGADHNDLCWSHDDFAELTADVVGEDEGCGPDDLEDGVSVLVAREGVRVDGLSPGDRAPRRLAASSFDASRVLDRPFLEDDDGDVVSRLEEPVAENDKAVDDDALVEAVVLGCVLEDAVDHLSILAHTSRAATLGPDLAKQSLSERLEAIDARETERRDSVIPGLRLGAGSMELEEDNARVDKIQRDRALVQEALRLQLQWLRLPRQTPLLESPLQSPMQSLLGSPMCRLVREEERRSAEESVMLAESASGVGRADRLRSTVLAEQREARRQIGAMREERASAAANGAPGTSHKRQLFGRHQEEARSLRARAALGAAITDRWERARMQQHQRHLHGQEDELRASLHRVKAEHGLELRAHAELVEYLEQATQSLEVQGEDWQVRYEEVTAGWDAKLTALKAQRQGHSRQLRAVRKELARRERFKREFLAYKTARDAMIEERVRANTAATRIQSWWRMTMVRKGLGPWKRMAKKKKKKKK